MPDAISNDALRAIRPYTELSQPFHDLVRATIGQFWDQQRHVATIMTEGVREWADRRNADADKDIATARKFYEAPTDFVQAYQTMVLSSLERMAEDSLHFQRQMLASPDVMVRPLAELAEATKRASTEMLEAQQRSADALAETSRKLADRGKEVAQRTSDAVSRAGREAQHAMEGERRENGKPQHEQQHRPPLEVAGGKHEEPQRAKR
jgi:cell division septum initiation protein DivIVA